MILTAALIALGGEGWAVMDPIVTCLYIAETQGRCRGDAGEMQWRCRGNIG